jgi:hypothetical protein
MLPVRSGGAGSLWRQDRGIRSVHREDARGFEGRWESNRDRGHRSWPRFHAITGQATAKRPPDGWKRLQEWFKKYGVA